MDPIENFEARKVLASNRRLHRAMRETITKAWPEATPGRGPSPCNAPFPFCGKSLASTGRRRREYRAPNQVNELVQRARELSPPSRLR
jgi:hypothetical protein